MLFLYDLPNWLMGVSIIATIVALSYAGYFAFHRNMQRWDSEIAKTAPTK